MRMLYGFGILAALQLAYPGGAAQLGSSEEALMPEPELNLADDFLPAVLVYEVGAAGRLTFWQHQFVGVSEGLWEALIE